MPGVLIVLDPALRTDPEELRRLVREGFEGIDGAAVEVRLERSRGAHDAFSGRAYGEPLRRPRSAPGTRFPIRLWLPAAPRDRGYPRSYRYARRTTAPWITVAGWRERFVALVAHEAFHVRQFREGLRRSEVAAERWAERVLSAWRGRSVLEAPGEAAGVVVRGWEQLRFALNAP